MCETPASLRFATGGCHPSHRKRTICCVRSYFGHRRRIGYDDLLKPSGTLEINTTDSTHANGGCGFSGDNSKFKNVKIGYDNNADDDIDDAGDDIVYDSDFSGTSTTISSDDNGNLTEDETFKYVYDAWNRLVEAKTRHDAVTATYEYDARG